MGTWHTMWKREEEEEENKDGSDYLETSRIRRRYLHKELVFDFLNQSYYDQGADQSSHGKKFGDILVNVFNLAILLSKMLFTKECHDT